MNELVIELYKEYFIVSKEIFEKQNELNLHLNKPLSFEETVNLTDTTILVKSNNKLVYKKGNIQKTIFSILKSNWELVLLYKELTSSLEEEKYEEAELIKNKIKKLC
jgi:hypothetical protein